MVQILTFSGDCGEYAGDWEEDWSDDYFADYRANTEDPLAMLYQSGYLTIKDVIREELKKGCGTQFDPEYLPVFLELVEYMEVNHPLVCFLQLGLL